MDWMFHALFFDLLGNFPLHIFSNIILLVLVKTIIDLRHYLRWYLLHFLHFAFLCSSPFVYLFPTIFYFPVLCRCHSGTRMHIGRPQVEGVYR
jgi:hypothetical protein